MEVLSQFPQGLLTFLAFLIAQNACCTWLLMRLVLQSCDLEIKGVLCSYQVPKCRQTVFGLVVKRNCRFVEFIAFFR